MADFEIPPGYDVIPHSDTIDRDAINRQFELAQPGYDPGGIFYQRQRSEWQFTITRDTRNLDIPAIFQTEATELTGISLTIPDAADIGLRVKTPDGEETFYTAHDEEHIPFVDALLRGIAHIDLAEFCMYPQAALEPLTEFDAHTYHTASREIVQKTFDPEHTETHAVSLRALKLVQNMVGLTFVDYRMSLGRIVDIRGADYLYLHNVLLDSRDPEHFYRKVLARELSEPVSLGEAYSSRVIGRPVPQLDETLGLWLGAAGNRYVHPLRAHDVNEVVSQPLTAEHRLVIPDSFQG